jgi:hypothetical protein
MRALLADTGLLSQIATTHRLALSKQDVDSVRKLLLTEMALRVFKVNIRERMRAYRRPSGLDSKRLRALALVFIVEEINRCVCGLFTDADYTPLREKFYAVGLAQRAGVQQEISALLSKQYAIA